MTDTTPTESQAPLAIDVHCHVVPDSFPPPPAGAGSDAWPSVRLSCTCHGTVFMGGRKYREIDDRCWNLQRRQQDMDAAALGIQALSPMPELLSYWLPAEEGARICRFLNEQIAGMVAGSPRRFVGLGAVPLQDVPRAIEELRFLMEQLGLHGVEVGSNVADISIGDARFRPFFEAAQALGAAVFVHPLRPAGMDRLVGPPILEQMLAFPGEIALAGAALITGGTLESLPGLRVCLSHGGGSLAQILPRLEAGWRKLDSLQAHMQTSPTALARRMYYDLCVFDPAIAAFVLDSFGDDRVVIGTDYPFPLREETPVRFVEGLGLDAGAREKLLWRNARGFLGMD